jgi:NADH-quinone oxidoreductase subunit E
LGVCDHAPAMMIDGNLHTDLDAANIDSILERYQ